MCVDPDDANFLVAAAVELGETRDGAGGEGVVASQDEGGHAFFEGFEDGIAGPGADFCDLGEITGIMGAGGLGFGNFDADVSAVGDAMAEGLEPGFKAGNAHGGGSHVDSAAAGAHVKGDADDADLAGWKGLGATVGGSCGGFGEG